MKLYNTLSRKVEDFIPLNPSKVGMYTCGPTVYDHMHIGNLRTFIFSDVLRRVLEANGFEVKSVQNITDIDDKIIKRAKEKEVSTQKLADEYTNFFLQDMLKLNIKPVHVQPKATEHVGQMVKYIEELIKKDLAYVEKDGSVYFDISKFPSYGKLSSLETRTLKTGTRILSDEYSKRDAQDFALWKAVNSDEAGWDSPWGKGRPGWHIECSVMSQEYLGNTFDIHAGGVDLLFPHHENEIAQSEGKTGKLFVKYFVHGEHMFIDGKKMSKSLGNYLTLRDIEEKGFDSLALRYLFLTAHYRDKINFTWEALSGAQNTLEKIREEIRGWDLPAGRQGPPIGLIEQSKEDVGQFWQRFLEAANNDLNLPQALAVMHEMLKSDAPLPQKAEQLLQMDTILGLGLDEYLGKPLEVPTEVMELVEKRENVRKSGNFEESDKIRKEIKKLGYEVEDTADGPKIKLSGK